jgi:iron(III) transport system permease protein
MGRTGIIILSEIIYTFPQAFLMFFIALNYADGRLYEAADSMGCSSMKKFSHITIPSVRYTLINSLICLLYSGFYRFRRAQGSGRQL